MRIGIYDPYLDTMSGGEKYMLSIADSLSPKHDVSVFWDLHSEEIIRDLAKKRFDFEFNQISFKENIFSKEVSFFERLLISRQFDYIFVLSDGSIPVLACPLVLHFQSPLPWVGAHDLKSKIKLSLIHKFICNSEFTKRSIDKTFGIQSDVIYPPIDLENFSEGKKKNIILNVGRFGIKENGSSYKKQDVLADIFSRMVKNGLKNWELVFVMSVSPQNKDFVDSFIKKYEKYPITFLLNESNSKVKEMYSCAKIYWHASGFDEDIKKHPDRAEHFGMSTVEAMASAAVPVVFGAGGQVEIVENSISGYLWKTEEELIARTLELIEDDKMRNSFSENAKKRAKVFSKEVFSKEIIKILS